MKFFMFTAVFFVISGVQMAYGLDSDEILVIANSEMPGSLDLAHTYMQMRNIPHDRLLSVSVSAQEVISRQEYEKAVLLPVRTTVRKLRETGRVHCLVLFYGMPLKISAPHPDKGGMSRQKTQRAALDSEIALALIDSYPLEGWLENPYFLGFQHTKTLLQKDDVLMVSRLDGPDAGTVYRIMDDTMAAEKAGLQGKGYFDARWPLPEGRRLSGYALYDAAIHAAARLVGRRMPVRLDAREALFGPGECDHAALYCGWYSLGRYIDSFIWSKGAIGYHIASSECTTLKDTSSQVWCLKMLEKGAVATIGPVYEPYVEGFPLPDIFFGHLVEGAMSLGECYLISLPYLSWQMVLIGDPMYQPFRPPSSR